MAGLVKLLPWFLSAGVAWTLGYVYNVHYGGELNFLRQVYQQKTTLLNQVQREPRIILAGGSGVHYSVNSEEMEKLVGIPVFNFGLQGDIGLNVTADMILEKVRPKDIVILIPEYLMLLDEDGFGAGETLFGSGTFAWAVGKPQLGGLSPRKIVEDAWILGVPGLKILTRSAVQLAEQGKVSGYFSDPITEKGDPTFVKPRVGRWWKIKIDRPISEHSLQRIEKLQQQLKAKGAHLVVSLSWLYADTEDPQTVNNVRVTGEKLAQIVPTVYNKETLNLKSDSSLFADTHYHLLAPARLVRTRELAEQLKPVLQEFSQSSTQTSLR
jgi:hypothetical protein